MSKKTIGLTEALDWMLACESDNPDCLTPGDDENTGFTVETPGSPSWTGYTPLAPSQINRAREIEYHAYLRKISREAWKTDSLTVIR